MISEAFNYNLVYSYRTMSLITKNKVKSKSNEDEREMKMSVSDYWRERTIFPGIIPKDVKILIKSICQSYINRSLFRKLIKAALAYLQGTTSSEKHEIAFQNLCQVKNCETEKDIMELSVYYAGVVSLLRAVLKVNLKTVREDALMHDLKELGLPEDFAADACKVVFGPAHEDIMNDIIMNNPHWAKLEHFSWHVDVTLSNNWVSKVLEPSVVMKMKTSEGETYNFEVPISAFHLLRHSTATILRQMEALERRK